MLSILNIYFIWIHVMVFCTYHWFWTSANGRDCWLSIGITEMWFWRGVVYETGGIVRIFFFFFFLTCIVSLLTYAALTALCRQYGYMTALQVRLGVVSRISSPSFSLERDPSSSVSRRTRWLLNVLSMFPFHIAFKSVFYFVKGNSKQFIKELRNLGYFCQVLECTSFGSSAKMPHL